MRLCQAPAPTERDITGKMFRACKYYNTLSFYTILRMGRTARGFGILTFLFSRVVTSRHVTLRYVTLRFFPSFKRTNIQLRTYVRPTIRNTINMSATDADNKFRLTILLEPIIPARTIKYRRIGSEVASICS